MSAITTTTTTTTAVPGLFYFPDFLTAESTAQLMQFLEAIPEATADSGHIDGSAWQRAGPALRRVLHFGYRYPYSRALRLTPTTPIPELMQNVITQLRQLPGLEQFTPDQAIINRYETGQGIGAHTDHTRLFGDVVVSITLGASGTMVFRRAGETPCFVHVQSGSAYMMSGDARWLWTHEMQPNSSAMPRYSITFRQVMPEFIQGTPNPPLPIYLPPEEQCAMQQDDPAQEPVPVQEPAPTVTTPPPTIVLTPPRLLPPPRRLSRPPALAPRRLF
jgi:alkylated DNA repair dioxygenase AlkB